MSLESTYFIAQIIAAAAVIGTLVYGIVQIRINNRLALTQLTNETQQFVNDYNLAIGLDQTAARTFRKGLSDDETLEPDEWTQFNFLITAAFSHYEQQLFLRRQKLIATEVFDRADRQLRFLLSQEGVKV